MKVYVGTSGWLYEWNKGKNFDWFVENSGLNSVELNASFYRFPFPNQIKAWENKCKNIKFSVKVHRKITHILAMKEEAISVFNDFLELFSPLDKKIDFYLFQLSPSFKSDNLERIEKFFSFYKNKSKFAIEFRNQSCFNDAFVKKIEKIGLVFVSVDSPEIKEFIVKTNETVYLRFHGRTNWYNYNYSAKELIEISKKIKKLKPKNIYVYFNNNHNMLSNAQHFYKILTS